jgi:hypothetical protein
MSWRRVRVALVMCVGSGMCDTGGGVCDTGGVYVAGGVCVAGVCVAGGVYIVCVSPVVCVLHVCRKCGSCGARLTENKRILVHQIQR